MKKVKTNFFVLVILLLWVSGVLTKNVGATGGEVRHSEIGKDSNLIRINKKNP